MIRLYYLAQPEREHRFDPVFSQLDVVATFFPLISVPSLVALVTRDRMVGEQDLILCDLKGAEWSDEHILSAVQMLRRFSVARMVFLSPPDDHTTALYKLLADRRVEGLIVDAGDPSGELIAVLQGDHGYARRLAAIRQGVTEAADREVSPLRIPSGLVLDVAVCGAMPRVGTTTQALGLYHYLARLGFRPAILDQGALKSVLDAYRDRAVELEGCVEVNGARIASERSPLFNAFITDCGVMSPEWVKPICAADLTVLVGGVKPWELPALADASATLTREGPRELVTILSFSTPEDMETVGRFLDGCVAAPYHPDPWLPGSDTLYRSAVLPRLKRLCGQR